MLPTLLLNSTYEAISFINERKAFKLLAKEKAEVISAWEEKFTWGSGQDYHPAIIRLKYKAPWIPRKARFNRYAVFKRDQNTCQYCGTLLSGPKLTLDHIIPRAKGGANSWRNCVTACYDCNNRKGNKSLEQAKMKLLNKPFTPNLNLHCEFQSMKKQHQDWKLYLGL